jgi:hypothetical protein
MKSKEWISHIFAEAAKDFANRCINGDSKVTPLSDWEIEKLRSGIEKGHFSINGSIIQNNKNREYRFFSFNREYFAHFAMLVEALSWELPNSNVEFEYNHFDLMVLLNGKPYIGIEVKKSKKDAEGLMADMLKHTPSPDLKKGDRGIDGLRKIKYLLESKPPEFWVVCPDGRWKFQVSYSGDNLELSQQEYSTHNKAA